MRILVVIFISVTLIAVFQGRVGYSQSAHKLKIQEEDVRQQMLEWSRHLSVTCTECHKVENFKDASKPNFKKAKEHMRFVEILKSSGLDGHSAPLATCYMCHRGELRPAYREGLKVVPVKKEEAPKKEEANHEKGH